VLENIMSKLLKSKILLGVFIVTLVVVGSVASATKVSAATCSDSITSFLKQGSTGAQVSCLQKKLGMELTTYGTFGPLTKAQVVAFQTENSLPADGLVGVLTRAALNGTTTTTTTTTTTGALCPNGMTLASNCTTAPTSTTTQALCPNGMTLASNCTSAGTTTTVVTGVGDMAAGYPSLLGTPNNKAVGAGDIANQVLGFEVKADTGSGINLTSLKLKFDHAGTGNVGGSSTHIADYIKGVSVWMGSTKIGSTDIANFAKSNTGIYEGTIALTGATISTNAVQRFYVSVDANPVIDSGDYNEFWSTMVTSIRFTDGTGAIMTYSNSATVNSGTMEKLFKTQSYATANSIDLKATVSSTNPQESVVLGKKASTYTTEVLKFTLKAEGSDITVNKIPVLLTSTTDNLGVLATDAVLSWSGSNSDSQSVTASALTQTVTFGNTSDLGIKITDGSSLEFQVTITMAKLDGSTVHEGDSIKGDLTIASVQATDAVDGDVATFNGSANGYAQHLYTIAPVVTVGTTSITPVANGGSPTKADAYVDVTILAQGGTIYLNGVASATVPSITAAANGDVNTTLVGTSYTPSGSYVTTGSGATEYYTINDGQSMTIRVAATVNQATTTARGGLKLTAIHFGTDNSTEVLRGAYTLNWSNLTDKLKTAQVTLN
jgi:hypothetical protein